VLKRSHFEFIIVSSTCLVFVHMYIFTSEVARGTKTKTHVFTQKVWSTHKK